MSDFETETSRRQVKKINRYTNLVGQLYCWRVDSVTGFAVEFKWFDRASYRWNILELCINHVDVNVNFADNIYRTIVTPSIAIHSNIL